jgi:hypothetical protein
VLAGKRSEALVWAIGISIYGNRAGTLMGLAPQLQGTARVTAFQEALAAERRMKEDATHQILS